VVKKGSLKSSPDQAVVLSPHTVISTAAMSHHQHTHNPAFSYTTDERSSVITALFFPSQNCCHKWTRLQVLCYGLHKSLQLRSPTLPITDSNSHMIDTTPISPLNL